MIEGELLYNINPQKLDLIQERFNITNSFIYLNAQTLFLECYHNFHAKVPQEITTKNIKMNHSLNISICSIFCTIRN